MGIAILGVVCGSLLLFLVSFVLFLYILMNSLNVFMFFFSLNVFIIISLSSLLGRLPISTLNSSSLGVLSCHFIWNMFLCCLILPNLVLLFLSVW